MFGDEECRDIPHKLSLSFGCYFEIPFPEQEVIDLLAIILNDSQNMMQMHWRSFEDCLPDSVRNRFIQPVRKVCRSVYLAGWESSEQTRTLKVLFQHLLSYGDNRNSLDDFL